MPDSLGTRRSDQFYKGRADQGADTRSRNGDKGMTKRVSASITFTASNGRATGANGTFTSTFSVGDPVMIQNTNLNNSFHTVTGLDGVNAAYLVLDPAPKDEGPLTALLRTP